MLQLTVSSLMLLAFAVLAPQAAFYFLTLLFTVFGFGSLGLTRTQAVCSWIGVSIAVAIVLSAAHLEMLIPDSTQSQKYLVWLCFSATLGRCMLLGVLGRSLRLHLQDRRRQLRTAVERLEERDKALELVNLELRRQATHDALTGLANRALLVERLEQALREGEAFAVCALDLNGFKEVNDTLGHIAGDSLLQSVSQRLLGSTRADDTVARTGGDEYLLLLRHIQCSAEAEAQAQRCLEVLSAPHRIGERNLRISSSLGIARYPIDGTTAETILTYADAAMYHAKRSGKNAYRLYDGNIECFPRGCPSGEDRVYCPASRLIAVKIGGCAERRERSSRSRSTRLPISIGSPSSAAWAELSRSRPLFRQRGGLTSLKLAPLNLPTGGFWQCVNERNDPRHLVRRHDSAAPLD